MAIGTITMILANVGLSIFNNWAGSRQNKQIAEKREEFERAAREGQRERMLQLMREGQQLTLELEEQKHKERLSELNDQFDNLIKELAYSAAIEHWPLKTLPIVMKNQALGNLLANQEEKVALHCILTSSNCREFNDYVLPKVESALEAYCNVHWSTLTGSPVLFYSGAWKSNDVPTGTQVDSMRAALSNLPTLLITPFFRPQDHKLVFQAHVWGVGYNNSDQFTIPVIEPTEFQRDYTDELGWLAEEGLIEEAVEDFVPYLQCLIGYIADTYFWSAFGSVPQLPRMLTDGTINTDGMKYLVDETREYYDNLLVESQEKAKEQPFADDNLQYLVEGTKTLWNDEVQKKNRIDCVLNSVHKITNSRYNDLTELIEVLPIYDMNIIDKIIKILRKFGFVKEAEKAEASKLELIHNASVEPQNKIRTDIFQDTDLSVLEMTDILLLEKLAKSNNAAAQFRLGELYEYSIGVDCNKDLSEKYYNQSLENGYILAKVYYLIHSDKAESIDKNMIKGLEYLNSQSVKQSMIFTSMLLYNGVGFNMDRAKAIDMLDKINTEHPLYLYWGAKMLMECGIEEKDNVKTLLCKCADMGYVKAQIALMSLLRDGTYLDVSPKEALLYAQKAASQGAPLAFRYIGECYINGFGVKRDYNQAKKYFEVAVKLGDDLSKQILLKIR